MKSVAAQPLGKRPQRRDDEHGAHAGDTRELRLQRAGEREVGREDDAEGEGGEGRERRRHGAEAVQADVDPRHAREEQPMPNANPDQAAGARARRA